MIFANDAIVFVPSHQYLYALFGNSDPIPSLTLNGLAVFNFRYARRYILQRRDFTSIYHTFPKDPANCYLRLKKFACNHTDFYLIDINKIYS